MLAEILAHKRTELPTLRAQRFAPPPPRRTVELRRSQVGRLSLIAEIKHRSPSAGPLSTHLSVEQRAQAYERAGASMLSVLCDKKYFGGDFEHLTRARQACSLPILCKEFIVDPVQLDAARGFGADAVLLIVRCLEQDQLEQLIAQCAERELEALVEIHQPEEAIRALDAGARWIGVNARDLQTLKMDSQQAQQVLESLPVTAVRTHLSGVHTPMDIQRVAHSPADAALIGETLMRQDDPSDLLHQLVSAAQNA